MQCFMVTSYSGNEVTFVYVIHSKGAINPDYFTVGIRKAFFFP